MKKMDLVNGHFTLRLKLQVDIDDGKVARVTLVGDRGDPRNLFQFIGTVGDVIHAFNPNAQDKDADVKLLSDLGLMRGDDADDIGRVRISIQRYAEIDCLYQPSRVSTETRCTLIPRSWSVARSRADDSLPAHPVTTELCAMAIAAPTGRSAARSSCAVAASSSRLLARRDGRRRHRSPASFLPSAAGGLHGDAAMQSSAGWSPQAL